MVCVAFTGTDHVDLEYCRRHNITVSNCAGYATDAVAELVFGLALQLLRNLPACDQAARSGESSAGLRGQELAGKTFGCHVLAYNRTPKDVPGIRFTDLDTLLRESDIISLHVPATEETTHLIDEAALQKLKPTAILIN